MAESTTPTPTVVRIGGLGPFRRAVLRGLGVVLPPLLTIVIFLWVAKTVAEYVLVPLENSARWTLVEYVADIRSASEIEPEDIVNGRVKIGPTVYTQTADSKLIPIYVYEFVDHRLGNDPMPGSAKEIYVRYINERWLPRWFVVPVFLCVFILVLYLLGRFLAAGVGRFFVNQFERLIDRLPLIRTVYASVKQVTDFFFSQPEIHWTRVVAVEYPRRGMWSLTFVTGEGMEDIGNAAQEPVLTIFVPTSPMPLTGFALTVKKSEVVEINISLDQAVQFIMSCGVVIPAQQMSSLAAQTNGSPPEFKGAGRLIAPISDD